VLLARSWAVLRGITQYDLPIPVAVQAVQRLPASQKKQISGQANAAVRLVSGARAFTQLVNPGQPAAAVQGVNSIPPPAEDQVSCWQKVEIGGFFYWLVVPALAAVRSKADRGSPVF